MSGSVPSRSISLISVIIIMGRAMAHLELHSGRFMANIWKGKGFYLKGRQFLYITKNKDCQAGNPLGNLGNLAQLKIEVSLELSIANPTGLIIGDRGCLLPTPCRHDSNHLLASLIFFSHYFHIFLPWYLSTACRYEWTGC